MIYPIIGAALGAGVGYTAMRVSENLNNQCYTKAFEPGCSLGMQAKMSQCGGVASTECDSLRKQFASCMRVAEQACPHGGLIKLRETIPNFEYIMMGALAVGGGLLAHKLSKKK